jgi:hypothetical protein
MIHKKVYRELEEIMDYLVEAKQQLSTWKKNILKKGRQES